MAFVACGTAASESYRTAAWAVWRGVHDDGTLDAQGGALPVNSTIADAEMVAIIIPNPISASPALDNSGYTFFTREMRGGVCDRCPFAFGLMRDTPLPSVRTERYTERCPPSAAAREEEPLMRYASEL